MEVSKGLNCDGNEGSLERDQPKICSNSMKVSKYLGGVCFQAKREHDASMIHHVRLQQANVDCEHICRICRFICKELSEYSKVNSSSLVESPTRNILFKSFDFSRI